MKRKIFIVLFLVAFRVSAQEGRAVRPLEAAKCETSQIIDAGVTASLEQCYYKNYRFTTKLSSQAQTFEVSRMESGTYLTTTVDKIFKDHTKASEAFNAKIRKAINQLMITSKNRCLMELPQNYALADLAFSFENRMVVISLPLNAKCAPVSTLQVKMPLREFDRMLK